MWVEEFYDPSYFSKVDMQNVYVENPNKPIPFLMEHEEWAKKAFKIRKE